MTLPLLSYDLRHTSVLTALAATGRYELILAAAPEMVPLVSQIGFPFQLVREFYTRAVVRAGRARVLALLPRWRQALQDPAFQAQFEFQGRSLWPRLQGPLVAASEASFEEAIFHAEMLHSFTASQRPRLILMPQDVTLLTRTVAQAARRLGIPTLHVEHGNPALRNGHDRIHTHRIAVYGPYCRDWYVAQGNDPERIVVTGNPNWDGYARKAAGADQEALRRRIGVDPARPAVLFASSWTHRLTAYSDRHWVEEGYRCVLRAVAALQASHGVQLIVKLHPGERHQPETYARVAAEEGVTPAHIARHPLHELLLASDAVICLESNLAIEAMLLQRPVITLTLEEFPISRFYRLFDDRDAVLRVSRPEDMAPAILAACTDGPVRDRLAAARSYSLERFNYLNDDGATARVVQLVEDLIASSPPVGGRGGGTEADSQLDRPEVQALVPETATRVLDVGCGTGLLGEGLKRRGVAEVWGVEPDPDAAAEARSRLDRVLDGRLAARAAELPDSHFGCIVLADPMADTGQALASLKRCLVPGGVFVASIAGAPANILKLFNGQGLAVHRLAAIAGAQLPDEVERAPTEESPVSQYLVVAALAGLCSIVILTRNGIDYTKFCVELLQQHTPEPHELIFVDNGATDGTSQFLRTVPGARVIANATDIGFAAACNQGLAAATGERVVLLDDGVLVTEGWLGRLLGAAASDPAVGLVGPRSNDVPGDQAIAGVPYGDDLPQLQVFARKQAMELAGRGFYTKRVLGFCLLLTRAVIEKIGGLDTRFSAGNLEEVDFCVRARMAGFRIWVADDVFVHHFGSRAATATGTDPQATMAHNWSRFLAKHQLPPDLPAFPHGYPANYLAAQPFEPRRHYVPLQPPDAPTPESGYELFSRFLEHYNRQDYPEAIRSGDAILSQLEAATSRYREPDILFILANGYLSAGRYDTARQCYQVCFAVAKERLKSAGQQEQLLRLASIVTNNMAILEYGAGRPEEALPLLDSLAGAPVSNEVLEVNRQAMVERRTVLQLQELDGHARPVAECQLSLAARWRVEGIAAFRSGDFAAARERFQAVCDTFVSEASDHRLLGLTLSRLGRHGRAIDSFTRALALAPVPEVYLETAQELIQQGDPVLAERCLLQASELAPGLDHVERLLAAARQQAAASGATEPATAHAHLETFLAQNAARLTRA